MAAERHDVVVAGAGLAGLACADSLVDNGLKVLVLEAKPYVGGRTASWIEDGMPVESGHHRMLGFYKALPGLLRKNRVDLPKILCWEDEVIIRAPEVSEARFGASPVFRPIRTVTGALGNNHFLTPRDKLGLLRFFIAGLRDYLRRPEQLDQIDVEAYARQHKVSDRAIQRLVVPASTGVFFLPANQYSAYAFFATVAKAARRPNRMRIGAFEGGMTEVMAQPIAKSLERRGAVVRTGVAVTKLAVSAGRVTGVETEHRPAKASSVVVATPINVAKELISAPFGKQSWCQPMLSLKTMSAATLQLELSKPIYPVDRTIFGPGTVLASFGEQARTTFKHAPGRLSIILSPPDEFVRLSSEEVFERVMEDAPRIGFDLRPLVTDYRVINEPDQFYALSPGQDALRPNQRTPVPGLVLAGGYTKQPWLDTMEGAVISGQRAASAVMGLKDPVD